MKIKRWAVVEDYYDKREIIGRHITRWAARRQARTVERIATQAGGIEVSSRFTWSIRPI